MEKINFILDDIRRACELGDTEEVISLSQKLKSIVDSHQPIPKYKTGGKSVLAIVGDNSKPEIILDRNVPFKSSPFGDYRGGITVKEMGEISMQLHNALRKNI